MSRANLLREISDYLLSREVEHPLRVGIDGWCGSGKTVFRRALADQLRHLDRTVLELDSDGFHHTRTIRYRQGRVSGRGYYEDAYNLAALESLVLRPLGPDGDRTVAVSVHELATDRVETVQTVVGQDAIVLFDCTFIQRGALREAWDEVLYLDVADDVVRARGVARDSAALGGDAAAEAAYDGRYLAACRIYRDEERPAERASIVIDNTDVHQPRLVRGPWTPPRQRVRSARLPGTCTDI